MIIPSGAVRVLVATRPVDFRKGMDGLAAPVQESLGSDPYSGVIYVFRAKRADRVKLLLGVAAGWCWSPSGWRRARFAGRGSPTA
jgi:transposase